jgi:hypothetical protein
MEQKQTKTNEKLINSTRLFIDGDALIDASHPPQMIEHSKRFSEMNFFASVND